MKRRFAIFGLVLLLVGGVMLLLGVRGLDTAAQRSQQSHRPPSTGRRAARSVDPPPLEAARTTYTDDCITPTGTFADASSTRRRANRCRSSRSADAIPQVHARQRAAGHADFSVATVASHGNRRRGSWNVMVAAQRYQRFTVISIAAGKATREVVMPLRRGHTLKGRVFDQALEPALATRRLAFATRAMCGPAQN